MSKWIGPLVAFVLMAAAVYVLAPAEAPDVPAPDVQAPDVQASDVPGVTAPCPRSIQVGSGSRHAALSVTFGSGSSRGFCIAYDGETVGAVDLLQATRLNVVYQEFGGALGSAVCKITDSDTSDGCDYPQESCFCSGPDTFWNLFGPSPDGAGWVRWEQGLGAFPVVDGSVLALVWGGEADEPSSCSFEQICPPVV